MTEHSRAEQRRADRIGGVEMWVDHGDACRHKSKKTNWKKRFLKGKSDEEFSWLLHQWEGRSDLEERWGGCRRVLQEWRQSRSDAVGERSNQVVWCAVWCSVPCRVNYRSLSLSLSLLRSYWSLSVRPSPLPDRPPLSSSLLSPLPPLSDPLLSRLSPRSTSLPSSLSTAIRSSSAFKDTYPESSLSRRRIRRETSLSVSATCARRRGSDQIFY